MRLRNALNWIILGFWLVMMGILIQRQICISPSTSLSLPPEQIKTMGKTSPEKTIDVHEGWLGIYFKEKKIGWLHLTTVPDKDGATIKEESIVRLKILDSQQEIWTKTTCRTDVFFALRSFDFQMRSGAIFFPYPENLREKPFSWRFTRPAKKQKKKSLMISRPTCLSIFAPI